VEVLSPSDRTTQVNRKVSEYLQAGVKVVLLVDPEERAVTVYRPEHTLQLLRETDAISGGDELPGFSCRVADFFLLPGTPPKANA
jgi:Uma2 family endonuclease